MKLDLVYCRACGATHAPGEHGKRTKAVSQRYIVATDKWCKPGRVPKVPLPKDVQDWMDAHGLRAVPKAKQK